MSTNPVQRSARVEALFPPGAIAFELRGGASADELFPAEREHVARAVEKRVREFAAGRLCARAGLMALGLEPTPLLKGPDRAPIWPPGVVGSITHTDGYCVAVVAPETQLAAIGVDAERLGEVDPPLWPTIMRPEEVTTLEALDESTRRRMATLIFSAKEAFYKCQYTLTRAWLGFEDALVRAEGDVFELSVVNEAHPVRKVGNPWVGHYCYDERIVIAAVAAQNSSIGSTSNAQRTFRAL
jgi:4'-phosphopantetheinyl transferase EntD